MKYPELFKPFTIGRCQIKNRIVMSPMHLGGRMDSDGNFNESVIDYYVARAKGLPRRQPDLRGQGRLLYR